MNPNEAQVTHYSPQAELDAQTAEMAAAARAALKIAPGELIHEVANRNNLETVHNAILDADGLRLADSLNCDVAAVHEDCDEDGCWYYEEGTYDLFRFWEKANPANVLALLAEREMLTAEIDRLARYIMDEVPGEPSQSQGAVDTIIRVHRALLAERETLRAELRVSGAWKLREYLDAATQREIGLHERIETEAREYTRLVEHATDRADRLAAENAALTAALQRARDVLDDETLIELNWKEAGRVGSLLRAALAAAGPRGEGA
jgi:hypothetical protein